MLDKVLDVRSSIGEEELVEQLGRSVVSLRHGEGIDVVAGSLENSDGVVDRSSDGRRRANELSKQGRFCQSSVGVDE